MRDNGSSESKLIRVCVAIPNEGHTQVEAYANRIVNFAHLGKLQERGAILRTNPRFEFSFITLGRIFTPLAREEAAKITLEEGFDYLYMIDDDMICPDDLFERLFRHDVDVIAPLAFSRNYPHHAVIYEVTEGFDPVSQTEYFTNHHVTEYEKDTLVESDAVGFGAALIKRKVLEKMEEPRFMCSSGTGEDILFCHKARRAGFRVFMDTATKLGHLSHPIEVTDKYVDKVRKEFNFEERQPIHSKFDRRDRLVREQ